MSVKLKRCLTSAIGGGPKRSSLDAGTRSELTLECFRQQNSNEVKDQKSIFRGDFEPTNRSICKEEKRTWVINNLRLLSQTDFDERN